MTQDLTSLPLVRAPPDALRHGFYSASEDARPVHEVQRLQTIVRVSFALACIDKIAASSLRVHVSCEDPWISRVRVNEYQCSREQHRTTNWELKMATVEQVYGKAAAMRLRTEKAVLEQFGVRLCDLLSIS